MPVLGACAGVCICIDIGTVCADGLFMCGMYVCVCARMHRYRYVVRVCVRICVHIQVRYARARASCHGVHVCACARSRVCTYRYLLADLVLYAAHRLR